MIIKWLFDRIMSLLGLLVLSPILVIVAVLIKTRMPGGSVLFTQWRVGKNGKNFVMYKFRSMSMTHNGSSVSVAGEARITPLGKILRRYKLDELPELWNVLKGDMSFVGPRPDVPGYADKLLGEDRKVLLLRPGITGPASLKYRDEEEVLAIIDKALSNGEEIKTDDGHIIKTVKDYNDLLIYPDKVRINLYYLKHYSFIKDIQMILCTVFGKKMMYNGEMI